MVDQFDKELISLLEQDARQSSEKLAEQLSASPSTVRRRMGELLKHGVIRIVAIPEPKQIGAPLVAVVAFQLQHEKLNSFMKTLGSRKDVKCLFVTSGRFDAIALMWFPSTEQLYDFMEREVGKIEGIRATETFVCLHTEKSF
ncbi:MAG: Lrp/AsnC family transcriptional regulator [Dehalococcoidales bacterium]